MKHNKDPYSPLISLAITMAFIAMALALVSLWGWVFHIPLLIAFPQFLKIMPEAGTMKFNTAVCTLLLGIDLISSISHPRRRNIIFIIPALITLSISIVILLEYLLGWNAGIDEIFFRDFSDPGQLYPGRMSVITASVFLLLSVSAIVRRFHFRAYVLWQGLALAATLFISIAIMGYFYEASPLNKIYPYLSMAITTTIALYLLSLAFLIAWPSAGFTRILDRSLAGGKMARKLLPLTTIILFFVGFVASEANHLGWFDETFDSVFIVSGASILLTWLIWSRAKALNAVDRALNKLYLELEQRVYDRTKQLELKSHIVTNMAEGVCLIRTNGEILFTNPRFDEIFGYAAGELIGKSARVLIYRGDAEESTIAIKKVISEIKRKGSYYYELLHVKKDGTPFWCQATTSLFNHPQYGEIFVSVQEDITQRKNYEEGLLDSERKQFFLAETARIMNETISYEQKLQLLAKTIVPQIADICVVRTVEDGVPAFKATAIVNQEQAPLLKEIATQVEDYSSTGTLSSVIQTAKPLLIENADAEIIEDPNVLPELKEVIRNIGTKSYTVVPLTVQGKVIGTFSLSMTTSGRRFTKKDLPFLQDMANRCAIALENARLYQKSVQAVADRERLLAIVSHDLKNPISSIDLASQLLLKQDISPETVQVLAKKLANSSKNMLRLISDLLDFGKIQGGAFTVESKPTQISEIMSITLESLQAMAQPKKIQLFIDIQKDLPPLHADPLRVAQVIWNLTGNAIKFTSAGGTVRLHAFAEGSHVKFEVQDNGPGISNEDLPRVFDRFWQAKKTATKGSGLGLSIAKGIVRAHGGEIGVTSKVGQGALFYFTIPFESYELSQNRRAS